MFLDSTGTLQPPVSGYGLISASEQSRICSYAMDSVAEILSKNSDYKLLVLR